MTPVKNYFFLWMSILQTILFFSFFWQRRPDLIPRRDLPVYRKTSTEKKTKRSSLPTELGITIKQHTDPESRSPEHHPFKEEEENLESFREVFGTLQSRVNMVHSKVKTLSNDQLLQSGIKSKLDFCTHQMKGLLSILEELCYMAEIGDSPPREEELVLPTKNDIAHTKKLKMHLNMSQVESMLSKEGGIHKASSAPPSEARSKLIQPLEGIKKIKEQAEETLNRISKVEEIKSTHVQSIKIESVKRKSHEHKLVISGDNKEIRLSQGIKIESARVSRRSGTKVPKEGIEDIKSQSKTVKLKKEDVKLIPKQFRKNLEVSELLKKNQENVEKKILEAENSKKNQETQEMIVKIESPETNRKNRDGLETSPKSLPEEIPKNYNSIVEEIEDDFDVSEEASKESGSPNSNITSPVSLVTPVVFQESDKSQAKTDEPKEEAKEEELSASDSWDDDPVSPQIDSISKSSKQNISITIPEKKEDDESEVSDSWDSVSVKRKESESSESKSKSKDKVKSPVANLDLKNHDKAEKMSSFSESSGTGFSDEEEPLSKKKPANRITLTKSPRSTQLPRNITPTQISKNVRPPAKKDVKIIKTPRDDELTGKDTVRIQNKGGKQILDAIRKKATKEKNQKPSVDDETPVADLPSNPSQTTSDPKGTVFDLWRKASETKEVGELSEVSGDSDFSESSDHAQIAPNVSKLEFCVPEGVISTYGISEEINKAGLARSKKKDFNPSGNKRKGPQMEDTNFCACPLSKEHSNVGLFCVFDGHAGNNCSTKLKSLFPKVFAKYWKNIPRDLTNKADLANFWRQVYREIDENLRKFEYEGSTATTVLIWQSSDGKRYLQAANVGDSTAYLSRYGLSTLISEDHKPTMPSEKKRLLDMGIVLGNQTRLCGLAVSRAFGDFFTKAENCGVISEPFVSDVYEIGIADTRVIIASDGLWDILGGQTAFDIIKDIGDPQIASKKLLDTALQNPKCFDNVTVIVINLQTPKF